jgi:hypothetical protein
MPVKNQVERIFKKHFAKINNAISISNGDIINFFFFLIVDCVANRKQSNFIIKKTIEKIK